MSNGLFVNHDSYTLIQSPIRLEDGVYPQNRAELLEKILETNPDKEPFYVIELDEVDRKFQEWVQALPRVRPFFAFKSSGDMATLRLLKSRGTGFDCASQSEIATCLQMGVPPEDIIYAHPCKPVSHLQFAKANGVKLMTFDNTFELEKIKTYYPEAKVVLRILPDRHTASVCDLGTKFGAKRSVWDELLQTAQTLELDLVGVSFHVGSNCLDSEVFYDAVKSARSAFDLASSYGHKPYLLDIGGGFPGVDSGPVRFVDTARTIESAIDTFFPITAFPDVQVIAEPGRYFVTSACTLFTNIIGKRKVVKDGNVSFMYYVNDGAYGSFNCILFDHYVCVPRILKKHTDVEDFTMQTDTEHLFECNIWGPTCDSMDKLVDSAFFRELHVGEWIGWENMGAYTHAAAGAFNGFPLAHKVVVPVGTKISGALLDDWPFTNDGCVATNTAADGPQMIVDSACVDSE